jgi:ring-1,2-phenylacetyl-CoA epoxidase subunit PaaD
MVNVWDCLRLVPDPEIPVVDVVSMGIVREVEESPDGVKVTITPTYSGCPAMSEIEASIRAALHEAGYAQVELKTQIAPAWTTDWITDEACEQLRSYGIAPPERRYASGVAGNSVACPFCASEETRLQSEFGSTLCKALHVCNDCRQPFERFKCI